MSEPQATPPRVKSIQRWALVLLVTSCAVNTIDRASLAVANPLIRHDLGLSVAEMGLLLSAFLWAYAFAQLPAGILIDRFGARALQIAGLTVWSAAQLACGLVGNTFQFAMARAVLGAGEAPQFPAGARIVGEWFAARHRGRATGIFTSGSQIGTGLAVPLITVLMLSFGWRWMFVLMGLLGFAVALTWHFAYKTPAQLGLTEEENAYRLDGARAEDKSPITFAEWRSLFGSVTTWGLVAGYFGNIYVNWLFNTWLPGYLSIERHMSLTSIGWAAAIPYIFAVLGAVSSGFIADHLVSRGVGLLNSRKFPLCTYLVVETVFVIFAALTPSNAVAIACLSCVLFCGSASSSTAWALVSVLAPPRCTGSLGSVQNFGGYVGGACAPIVTGLIVQAQGSFVPALYVGAGMSLASALIYFFVVRRPVTLGGQMSADPEGVAVTFS